MGSCVFPLIGAVVMQFCQQIGHCFFACPTPVRVSGSSLQEISHIAEEQLGFGEEGVGSLGGEGTLGRALGNL